MNTVLKRSAIMVSLLVIAVLGTVFATRVSFAEDFYSIKIEYKYSNGTNAHDPYVAVLRGGESLDVEVTNPVIPGYKPMSSTDSTAQEVRTINLQYNDIHESDTVTVYYLPDMVHYKVRYFMQNIRDDLYTEDLSLSNDYYEKYGYTGTFPDELEHIEFDGFTSLFHEPDAIAADGSTEFKLYYDRNYYLVSFDLGEGGYGVEPVYAKHGTNYTISEPKRMGYTFDGWVKSNENGDYLDENGEVMTDEAAIKDAAYPFIHGVVPIGNSYFKAVWEPVTSRYSIVYWAENSNSTLTKEELNEAKAQGNLNEIISSYYSVVAAKDFENVPSDTVVNYSDVKQNYDFFSYNFETDFPSMSAAQLKDFKGKDRYFELNETLSEEDFTDGKVTVSGDGTTRINIFYDRKPITMQFFYAMENVSGTVYLTSGTKNFSRSDSGTLVQQVKDAGWSKNVVNSVPQIADKYSGKLTAQYLADPGNNDKYWYYEVTAKYGADMKDIWYNDAFVPQQRKGSSDTKELVRFGSWAVENGSNYKTGKDNFTVKGRFDKLDEDVLLTENWLSSHTNIDPTELHFVASWMNTGNLTGSGWNDGAKRVYNFTYKNYVEVLPGEKSAAEAIGDTDYQSLIDSGAYVDIIVNNGRVFGLEAKNIVETYDAGVQYTTESGPGKKYKDHDEAIRANQTAVSMPGFTKLADNQIVEIYPGCGNNNPQSIWYEYDTDSDGTIDFDADHHADVLFFYSRDFHTLTYVNGNQPEKAMNVAYNAPFNAKNADGESIYYYEPEYYNPDLKDYYRFEGWYHTSYYYQKINFETGRMPSDDMMLYARWVPITCNVTFYNDFRAYSLNNALHTALVGYNTLIETSEVPEDDEEAAYKLTEPSNGAMFAGWYYIDENNQPVRFDPETIPVTRDLKLYAEWASKDTAKYKVTYAEQGTDVEVAPPTIGTVFVSKTRTFTAKGGSELDDAHKWVDGAANWWPTMSSHSMLIQSNLDGSDYEPNTFKFEYIKKNKVWYQVSYIDKETGLILRQSQDLDTAYAAVTERAQYVEGYIPDKLSRSIVLSASVNSNEEAAKAEELEHNQIIFFYTPSDTGTLYQIDHYLQNADDDSKYDPYYSETQTAVIGDTVDVAQNIYTRDTCTALAERGYTIDASKTTITVGSSLAESNVSVTLDGNVTVISVYYNRNSYKYTVKYYDYEAEKLHDADPTLWDGEIKDSETFDPQPVGKAVEINPPTKLTYTYEEDGETVTTHYTRIGSEQRSVTIRPDSDPPVTNIIKIYYKRDSQRKLSYKVFCNADVSETYATLSKTQELVENEEGIEGSTVTPVPDDDENLQGRYIFKGWYADPLSYKSTEPLTTEYHYAPSLPGADMTYYAVFEQFTVHADVEIRYNESGKYTDDNTAALDADGNVTGYKADFSSPHGYQNGEETPFLKNSKFTFTLNTFDSRIYKYEFAGWYEVLEDGKVIHRVDITTALTVDKDARIRNYRYIAMFKKKAVEQTLDYEIKYNFETRSNGDKEFVLTGTLSGDELIDSIVDGHGAYELNDEFIMSKAPFESNYGKTLCWTDKGMTKTSDINHKKLYAVVYAEQSAKKVYANYRLNSIDGYTAIETTVGANRNTQKKLAVLDMRGAENFSYWAIRKSADDRANVIAKCYDPWFSFCIMDNYWISPVFDDAEWSEAAQKSITLTHLGYFRNRWTDESGNIAANGSTDLLYTDFEIAFADGQTQIYGEESGYKTGVVLELCGKFDGESFNPADYNYHSDEANLKAAIKNGKVSVYNYDSSDSTKRRSIQISEIPTEKLTNKNRVEFFKGYRNTYKEKDGVKTYTNKTYIMKATAYIIDPDGEVTLSNSEYVCLTDIASKNIAVNGVCVSND